MRASGLFGTGENSWNSPIALSTRQRFPCTTVVLMRSEEHTSELQSRQYLVCRLLLEKKKKNNSKLANKAKIKRMGKKAVCTQMYDVQTSRTTQEIHLVDKSAGVTVRRWTLCNIRTTT